MLLGRGGGRRKGTAPSLCMRTPSFTAHSNQKNDNMTKTPAPTPAAQAKRCLLDPSTPDRIVVIYRRRQRVLFYNRRMRVFGLLNRGADHLGTLFEDWANISRVVGYAGSAA